METFSSRERIKFLQGSPPFPFDPRGSLVTGTVPSMSRPIVLDSFQIVQPRHVLADQVNFRCMYCVHSIFYILCSPCQNFL